MKEPTLRQKEVLDFITLYQVQFRCSPTYREIAKHFGILVNAGHRHVKALVLKGYLVPIISAEGRARGWRVTSSQSVRLQGDG